ncbi:MAG: helix-turn-helix domain-containing protein [Candidatus Geothermarchaeales archaeon]
MRVHFDADMRRRGSVTGLCEICGEDKVPLTKVIFEDSTVYACRRCTAAYGLKKPVSRSIPLSASRPRLKSLRRVFEEFPLISGYGQRIKSARVRRDLTQKDLARKIKEKESTIRNVENERLRPTPDVVSKLEHTLRIKLTSQLDEEPDVVSSRVLQPKRVTLGDVAVFKESRK